ncbi:MAG TPA: Ig-like domain-containing protein, partial [Ilumatobacteraceae bacterium]|nr:Ig-like domain-containing protein [Ilumatobacteraceae bacterium]
APAGTGAWTQIGTDLTANGSDEYTVDWDTTAVADIAYDLQVTFLDSVGNPTVQSLTGKTVDNELPTIALTAPPAGAVRRNVIAITANAADGVSGMREVRFEVKPAGAAGFSQVDVDNGSSPYSTAWDSTGSPDGPTDLRVIAVDQAGNLRSATTTIFVDNNAPTLTVSAPSTAVSGTVTLTATGSSDIQSVIFKVGGSPIGTDTDGSNGFSVSWSTVGDGNQVVTAEATDVGGNVGTSAPVTVQVDNTAPTGAMTQPTNGAAVSGTVSLAASAADAGSGVSGTSFEFKATSDTAWTAVGGSAWNTTSLATGAYNLRARITDNAGNAALTAAITVQVVPPAPVVVPPAPPAAAPATPAPSDPAPTVVAATPADGSVLTESPLSIDVTASEPLSAVTGLTLNGSPVHATIAGASFSIDPGELDTGAYTLAGTLVDATGKTTPFRLHFTVVLDSPAELPFVEANVPNGTATSLTAADGASVVTVPAGAVAGGGDWLVVRIQPLPASSVPAAPAGAPTSVVDVTARWALAGTEVHSFFVPLEIVLPAASASLVPATLEDGRWRALEPVAGGTALPLLARDGYIREGARLRILTRHLSVFALIPAPRLVLSVAAAKTFSWRTRSYVAARVKVSRAAAVTATLVGPRGTRLATWRRNVRAGASVVKLPLPRTARTLGAYRLVVSATAGGQTAQRTLGLRIVRKDGPTRTPGPAQVALAGDTRMRRTLALGLRGTGTRLIAADADGAFVLAANRGVRVVLVDVDRHGTALVRDLNAVFPT